MKARWVILAIVTGMAVCLAVALVIGFMPPPRTPANSLFNAPGIYSAPNGGDVRVYYVDKESMGSAMVGSLGGWEGVPPAFLAALPDDLRQEHDACVKRVGSQTPQGK